MSRKSRKNEQLMETSKTVQDLNMEIETMKKTKIEEILKNVKPV